MTVQYDTEFWSFVSKDNFPSKNIAYIHTTLSKNTATYRTYFTSINLYTPNVNYSWRTAPLTSKVAFYIFIQQIYVLNILNTVYTLRFFSFSSKCSLFHNSNVFGSCIIHILYTGCAKIKKKSFLRQKVNLQHVVYSTIMYGFSRWCFYE